MTSITDDWAGMAVSGPRSREVLEAAFPGIDVSNAALPFMGSIEAALDGMPLRITRLSYSGERAYEVYADAAGGLAVWERVMEAGRPLGLRPYGVEALGALRIEKGHVAGPEIDGRTTLDDLGLGGVASGRKRFNGDVLSRRPALADPDRPRLVGLECLDPDKRLRSGAILFAAGDTIRGHGRGHVTSVTYSPSLGRYVALALYQGGMRREGEEIVVAYPIRDETVRARIVSPVFLDPKGERLHG